jgi:hypothetical protein
MRLWGGRRGFVAALIVPFLLEANVASAQTIAVCKKGLAVCTADLNKRLLGLISGSASGTYIQIAVGAKPLNLFNNITEKDGLELVEIFDLPGVDVYKPPVFDESDGYAKLMGDCAWIQTT